MKVLDRFMFGFWAAIAIGSFAHHQTGYGLFSLVIAGVYLSVIIRGSK